MKTSLKRPKAPAAQRGVTLVVALIMMAALALMAAMALRMSTTNARVVGNAQVRAEAMYAAQSALEQTISYSFFVSDPTIVSSTPIEIDTDGDETIDYSAQITPVPTCYRKRKLPPEEVVAIYGALSDPGTKCGARVAESPLNTCSNTEYMVRAQVTDSRTGATFAVNQGVAVMQVDIDEFGDCR